MNDSLANAVIATVKGWSKLAKVTLSTVKPWYAGPSIPLERPPPPPNLRFDCSRRWRLLTKRRRTLLPSRRGAPVVECFNLLPIKWVRLTCLGSLCPTINESRITFLPQGPRRRPPCAPGHSTPACMLSAILNLSNIKWATLDTCTPLTLFRNVVKFLKCAST